MAREKVATKVWSDQVSHQSGINEENRDGEKKYEGELQNEVTEGDVRVGVQIAWCGVPAKIDTWVIHHP